jgi:DNA polymerase III epsilon subunit-like protein
MGTNIHHIGTSAYTFDLEYVGHTTNLKECYIWDIGIVHIHTGKTLEISIRPDVDTIPKPFTSEFKEVTDEYLTERHALPFKKAWLQVLNFVGHRAILIAHNAFRADKPMLEIETKRHGIKMPLNWFFFDSLIYARKVLPKLPSYSLRDLHMHLFQRDIVNQHTALPDAIALASILQRIGLHKINGSAYTPYSTPLQAVKWLGPSCERKILEAGIRSVEQLIIVLVNAYTDTCTSIPVSSFVRNYIIHEFNIKEGNASSIAFSLASNWIPGV